MLVLTRKRGETIRIGQDVVVKVIQMGKGSVKIGIEAPAHVRVLRGELQEFSAPVAASPISADDPPQEVDHFLAEFSDLFDLELDDDDDEQMHLECAILMIAN